MKGLFEGFKKFSFNYKNYDFVEYLQNISEINVLNLTYNVFTKELFILQNVSFYEILK